MPQPIKPVYSVQCVMCPGTLRATTSDLKELIEIVRNHMRLMSQEPHHQSHKIVDGESESIHEHSFKDEKPETSDAFKWSITEISPLTEIKPACEIVVPIKEPA